MSNQPGGDDGLRQALHRIAQVEGRGEDCPAAEELVLSARNELEPEANEEIVLHIARCTACAAGWRVAREVSSAPVTLQSAGRKRPGVGRGWRYLAAAAVVVVGAGLGVLFLQQDGGEGPDIYREQQDAMIRNLLVSDAPLPRDDFLLRWSPGPEGTYYHILVSDSKLKTLASEQGVETGEYRIPQEALEECRSGDRILWKVTAHLPDGRRIESESFFARVE